MEITKIEKEIIDFIEICDKIILQQLDFISKKLE
jgi:hypothetical protein